MVRRQPVRRGGNSIADRDPVRLLFGQQRREHFRLNLALHRVQMMQHSHPIVS